jgi:uncharacterized membrane protein
MSLYTLIVFSRLEEVALSFEIGVLIALASTILWYCFDKFWKTYEKYQKKLDK